MKFDKGAFYVALNADLRLMENIKRDKEIPDRADLDGAQSLVIHETGFAGKILHTVHRFRKRIIAVTVWEYEGKE